MNEVFFDTSALIKRYINQPRSNEVIENCETADSLIITVIYLPGMISTLNRLLRERAISGIEYERTKSNILAELGI